METGQFNPEAYYQQYKGTIQQLPDRLSLGYGKTYLFQLDPSRPKTGLLVTTKWHADQPSNRVKNPYSTVWVQFEGPVGSGSESAPLKISYHEGGINDEKGEQSRIEKEIKVGETYIFGRGAEQGKINISDHPNDSRKSFAITHLGHNTVIVEDMSTQKTSIIGKTTHADYDI